MRAIRLAAILALLGCTRDAGLPATAPPARLHLAILTEPGTIAAGGVITPAPRIAVQDDRGNLVTSPTFTIAIALSAVGGAALGGTLARPTLNGVATFDDLTLQKTGGYSLIASAPTLASTVTRSFDVLPAAPHHLSFLTQPAPLFAAASVLPAAVQVAVLDAFENFVPSSSNVIAVTLQSGSSAKPLRGTLSRAAINGVASFDDLVIDSAGSFTLTATSGALVGARSGVFEVVLAPAFQLAWITIGLEQSCGLDAGGQAWCWGVGSGPTPKREAEGLTFTSLSAGGGGYEEDLSFTCGLTATGAAYCWGGTIRGALGDGSIASFHGAEPVLGGLSFKSISAGGAHVCALDVTGAAYCWGSNDAGELGVGDRQLRAEPAAVAGNLRFDRIVAGDFHTCATAADETYCWGYNGIDGNGALVPRRVTSSVAFADIAAGTQHSCGLTSIGAAFCWGDNTTGQLGTGTSLSSFTPVAVAGGRPFSTLATKGYTACGVSGGTGYCWGWNDWGQLGVGYFTPRESPQQAAPIRIAGSLQLSAIAVGVWHACALTTAGVPYCWGQNAVGQLGNGTGRDSAIPVPVIR